MDYANINFWFQAGYAAGYFAQGTFIDRFGVKKVFFSCIIVELSYRPSWIRDKYQRLHNLSPDSWLH
ncbi:hypothetical protein PS874_06100 [Pseudomonas fluorescens]|nr:hypothetical protein PS874_06100 [Pseudomonas fluorescens]